MKQKTEALAHGWPLARLFTALPPPTAMNPVPQVTKLRLRAQRWTRASSLSYTLTALCLNSDEEDHVLPRPCPHLHVTKKTGLGKVMGAKKTIFKTGFRKSNHLPTVSVTFFPRPVGGLCHSCLHTKALPDTRRELLLSENTQRLVSSK